MIMELLILYSGIITILFAVIWRKNTLVFREMLNERQHSHELRQTILNFIAVSKVAGNK
jgi:hypothetical protein